MALVAKTLKGIKCPDQVICPFVETLRCLCEEEEIKIRGKIGKTTAAAIEDQKRIGKHLMLRGILSRKWRDENAEYTKKRVQCKASHLLKVIWKQMFMPMWKQRNKILHT